MDQKSLRTAKRACRNWWLDYTTPTLRRQAAFLGAVLRHVLTVAAVLACLLGLLGLAALGPEQLLGSRQRGKPAPADAVPGQPRQEHWSMLLPSGNATATAAGFQAFIGSVAETLRAQQLDMPCLDYALKTLAPQLDRESLWLEFGVWTGRSLSLMGKKSRELKRQKKVFGFDSFKGLPEDWRSSKELFGKEFERRFTSKGAFDLQGFAPEFFVNKEEVDFVVGWFNESLPGFLESEAGPVSFLHIDSDLYSSALTVLNMVGPRLRPGSVIVFDELINYVGWRGGEVRALYEWLESPGFAEAGHTALQVVGYRGPNLLSEDSELEKALRAQGKEGRLYPQDAVFRVW